MTAIAWVFLALVSSASSLVLQQRTAESCGLLPTYSHAEPAEYADARPTKYDVDLKQTVDVTFVAGDNIPFKCDRGYTVDGSSTGATSFNVECAEYGYFKPHGMCLETSKCGAAREIPHANPTGDPGVAPGSLQYACAVGYSLDGEKVVPGGFGSNRLFDLRCKSFGQWESFEGECKSYNYLPAGKTNAMYVKAFEAIFAINCKGQLKKTFAEGYDVPRAESVCHPFEADDYKECEAALSDFKADFDKETKKWNDDNAHLNKDVDWHKTNFTAKPDIGDRAISFCAEMWEILENK